MRGGDVNNDKKVNAEDALVMYYAYRFEDLLEQNKILRRLLLNHLVNPEITAPGDGDYRQLLRQAKRLRTP